MRIGKIQQGVSLEEYSKKVRGPGRTRKNVVFYEMKPGDSVSIKIWPFDDEKDFRKKYRSFAANINRIGKKYGGKFAIRTVDASVGKIRVWKVE